MELIEIKILPEFKKFYPTVNMIGVLFFENTYCNEWKKAEE